MTACTQSPAADAVTAWSLACLHNDSRHCDQTFAHQQQYGFTATMTIQQNSESLTVFFIPAGVNYCRQSLRRASQAHGDHVLPGQNEAEC